MILYNVWFSFKPSSNNAAELAKTRSFLDDLRNRSKLHNYRLMKNRAPKEKSRLSSYQLMAEFIDDGQFRIALAEVNQIGIHTGNHGAMIENIDDFTVEIFEDI